MSIVILALAICNPMWMICFVLTSGPAVLLLVFQQDVVLPLCLGPRYMLWRLAYASDRIVSRQIIVVSAT
jgi:hypothetical protein